MLIAMFRMDSFGLGGVCTGTGGALWQAHSTATSTVPIDSRMIEFVFIR